MCIERLSRACSGVLATGLAAILMGAAFGQNPGPQNPGGQNQGPRGGATGGANPLPYLYPNASAPSRVLQRGDLEILTFETEQDYDRLQELLRQSQESKPEAGRSLRYFRSNMDGAVQPYMLWVPANMTAGKSYPLVVQLHGTNFHEVLTGVRTHFQGLGVPQWIEQDLPVIYIQTLGRANSFYRGMGEQDILEAIEDVKRTLPVDTDRIYIMGHSMGGAGSFTIGLHYPDHFGGIMPIDPAMWEKMARPEPIPDWMKAQVDMITPSHLYANARNVDVFFKNAGAGIQRTSTEFSDGIIERGGFSTMESFPRMPHNFGDQYPYSNFVTELVAHPIRKKPAVVNFETNTLEYNSAYWVTIDRLTRHSEMARIEASIDGVAAPAAGPRFGPGGAGQGGRPGGPGGGQLRGGQGAGQGGPGGGQFRGQGGGQGVAAKPALRISTVNIDAVTLRLAESPLPKGAPITIDGDVIAGPYGDTLRLSRQGGKWHAGEWTEAGLVKRHGLQGPIGDAFNSHFLAVYGEGDRDLAISELDAIRNPPGPLNNLTDFPMKAAGKVTAEDIASCNLVLFGTAGSNPIVRRIAKSLPAGLMKPGSVFIYPNPESPAHYVVVWSVKLLSGSVEPVHSQWTMPLNLLPDYVTVEGNKIASGGHFDEEWRLR